MRSVKGLLPRLMKYASSDGQRRVENFLTEVLAEFLNVLAENEPALHKQFIRDILLSDCHEPPKVLDQVAAAQHRLGWRSQEPIHWKKSNKFPDLVLFDQLNGRRECPLIIVESKINASIGTAGKDSEVSEDDDSENHDQISNYGNWLHRRNPDGALVLLTYATQKLPDFDDGDYGVQTRAISLWVRVAEWLSHRRVNTCDPVVGYLGKQLRLFLESKDIVQMEQKEIDLLGKFFKMRVGLDEDDRLDKAEASLTEILNSTRKNLEGKAPKYDYGALLCQKQVSEDAGIRLGWGFTSGNNSQWFPRSEGQGLVACVIAVLQGGGNPELVEALDAKCQRRSKSRSLGRSKSKLWKKGYPSSEYPSWYITCSAEELRKDPYGFTRAFERWAKKTIKEADNFIKAAMKYGAKGKSSGRSSRRQLNRDD